MKQCHDVMNEFHLWHQTNPVLFQYWKERSWVCQPKCQRGAFWQTRRGGSEGRRSCCGHLWQPPPRPPPPLPPLPLPPVQDAWDREHVGAAGFLLIQNQWNPNPCRGQSMAFGFLFDASCLNFFITLYKGRKKKKNREKFSTEKCVLWRFDTLVNESWRCKIASDLPLYDIEADLLWWDIIDSSVCNSICNRNKCALFFLNQFGEEFCWILINMVVKYSCSALLFLTTLHSNV